jgi:hypothetical protein
MPGGWYHHPWKIFLGGLAIPLLYGMVRYLYTPLRCTIDLLIFLVLYVWKLLTYTYDMQKLTYSVKLGVGKLK